MIHLFLHGSEGRHPRNIFGPHAGQLIVTDKKTMLHGVHSALNGIPHAEFTRSMGHEMFLLGVGRLPELANLLHAELRRSDDQAFGEIDDSGGNDFNMIRALGHPRAYTTFNSGVVLHGLAKKAAVAPLPVDPCPGAENPGSEWRAVFGCGQPAQAQPNLIFVASVAQGYNSQAGQGVEARFGSLR